jgi:hypothetical protein
MAPELVVKQMQFLKELAPKVSRVALLWNPARPATYPRCERQRRRPLLWECGSHRWKCGAPTTSTARSPQ